MSEKNITDAQKVADRLDAMIGEVDAIRHDAVVQQMSAPNAWHIRRLQGFVLAEVWGLAEINAALLEGRVALILPQLIAKGINGETEVGEITEKTALWTEPEWVCLMWLPEP